MSDSAPPVREGDTVVVDVVRLTPRGDGLAEHRGRTLHVPDLFPGERARVRVLELARRSRLGRARVLERLVDHPERTTPPCPRHASHDDGRCTGCPMMGLSLAGQRQLKRTMLGDDFGLVVDRFDGGGPELGYRHSAKRVVGGRRGQLRLGSYVRDSHRIASMAGCLVDHPRIRECADELVEVADELGIVPAHDTEAGLAGDLRYAWFKTDGEAVLVTLIVPEGRGPANELGRRLRSATGVSVCAQASEGNAIRGEALEHVAGEERATVEIAGHRVELGPLGFLQPNPRTAELAYLDLVCDPEGEHATGVTAFDLYAGAGVTTELLRSRFANVVPCESFPESAALLGVAPQSAERFLRNAIATGERPELVLANPPRSGLGDRVTDALCGLRPKRLQVMSCNPASLARDLERLSSSYDLERVRAYDTLPHTAHVELVAWLVARSL